MNIFLSGYFIIIAISYFSVIYMNIAINHEVVVIAGAILFIITLIDFYKNKFKFNSIHAGILIFTPLMIASLLVQ